MRQSGDLWSDMTPVGNCRSIFFVCAAYIFYESNKKGRAHEKISDGGAALGIKFYQQYFCTLYRKQYAFFFTAGGWDRDKLPDRGDLCLSRNTGGGIFLCGILLSRQLNVFSLTVKCCNSFRGTSLSEKNLSSGIGFF